MNSGWESGQKSQNTFEVTPSKNVLSFCAMYLFIQNGFSALTIRKSEYWSPRKNTEYVLLYRSHVQPRFTSLCKINNPIHWIKIQKTVFLLNLLNILLSIIIQFITSTCFILHYLFYISIYLRLWKFSWAQRSRSESFFFRKHCSPHLDRLLVPSALSGQEQLTAACMPDKFC